VIADDSALLREGLARLLAETGVEVLALVADADQLKTAVADVRPDIAVIDIRMPPTFTHEGARVAIELRAADPTLGIMLLSQSLESRYVTDLVRQHPRYFGYLLKDRVVDVPFFYAALQQVCQGGTVLDPQVVTHLLGRSDLAVQLSRLTDRERRVLALMAEGRSNRSISAELVIDEKTVESHISRIFTKLDLTPADEGNRRVLAVLAWLRN